MGFVCPQISLFLQSRLKGCCGDVTVTKSQQQIVSTARYFHKNAYESIQKPQQQKHESSVIMVCIKMFCRSKFSDSKRNTMTDKRNSFKIFCNPISIFIIHTWKELGIYMHTILISKIIYIFVLLCTWKCTPSCKTAHQLHTFLFKNNIC